MRKCGAMFRPPSAAEVRELVSGLELPERFFIGTATSGYQCEGGYNSGDGPRNNWAEWEPLPGRERTGSTTRFFDFPERDLDLARGLGLNAHRLTLEWARLVPVRVRMKLAAPPPWDDAALTRYVDILAGCRQRGLEPIVSLHHFTHPYWLGLDPWLSDEGQEHFCSHVETLVARINERLLARGHDPIRLWLTVNEPNVLAPGTYLARWMPSAYSLDLRAPSRLVRALDGLYTAHVLAYGILHRWYEARGLKPPSVSFNNFAVDFYEGDRLFVDLILSRSRGLRFGGHSLRADLVDRARAHAALLSPLDEEAHAASPERWLVARTVRRLGPRLMHPGRFPRLRRAVEESDYLRPLDFVAFDYYDASLANQVKFAASTYEPWEWCASPEGLELLLRANATDSLPVFVAENGMATRRPVGAPPQPRVDGIRRDDFVRAHLFHLLSAIKQGVDVMGYLHWSLTDNYEWGRFSPRFGLHAVDFQDPARHRDALDASGVNAASAYGRIARAIVLRDKEALAVALAG